MSGMYKSNVDKRGSVALELWLQKQLHVVGCGSRVGVSKEADTGLQQTLEAAAAATSAAAVTPSLARRLPLSIRHRCFACTKCVNKCLKNSMELRAASSLT